MQLKKSYKFGSDEGIVNAIVDFNPTNAALDIINVNINGFNVTNLFTNTDCAELIYSTDWDNEIILQSKNIDYEHQTRA